MRRVNSSPMKKILFILLAFIPPQSNAQLAFDRYFVFDTYVWGTQIVEIPGQGYFVAGIDDSLIIDNSGIPQANYRQGYVLKLNYQGDSTKIFRIGNGDTTYTHNFGNNSDDLFNSIVVTDDENLFLAGETQSYDADNFYDYDFWLIKMNTNLDTLWSSRFSIPDSQLVLDYAYCKKTHKDGIVFPGHQDEFSNGIIHHQLTAFDSSGQVKFHKAILPFLIGEFLGVVETEDNGFIAVGNSFNDWFNSDCSPLIVKTDSTGNVEWYQILPYSGDLHFASDVIKTINGRYIYAWANVVDNPGALHKVWISHTTKIDILGNVIWTHDYEYTRDEAQRLKELPNGNFMICGWTSDTIDFRRKALLQVCDSSGNTLWTRKISGDPISYIDCENGTNTSDGGFILCGQTLCCNYNAVLGYNTGSLWIAKTDSFGLITSVVNLPKPDFNNTLLGNPFPNPASQSSTISTMISPEISKAELLVFDLNGKQLQEIEIETGYNETSINLSAYSNGEYVIALSIDGFNGGTKKVVKK